MSYRARSARRRELTMSPAKTFLLFYPSVELTFSRIMKMTWPQSRLYEHFYAESPLLWLSRQLDGDGAEYWTSFLARGQLKGGGNREAKRRREFAADRRDAWKLVAP